MAGNRQLGNAKAAKNDEFYTQLADIQTEVNAYLDYDPDVFRDKTVLLPCDDPEWSNFTRFFAQNFERFGLKKLISTSYAFDSKRLVNSGAPSGRALPSGDRVFNTETQRHRGTKVPQETCADSVSPSLCASVLKSSAESPVGADRRAARNGPYWQPTLFEMDSPQYDAAKSPAHGKIFILDHDTNGSGTIDFNDLEWKYLDGDGDFRSDEVCRLRDEADIIVTNPPFSLFREFLAWIVEADKKFLIIGNMNAITYKEVFPLIMANKAWLGESIHSGDREFGVPDEYPLEAASWRIDDQGRHFIRVKGVRWFTNLDHGRRHQPLQLMTMADNIKFSKHKELRGCEYRRYDNYDAIEVPFTDAIPSDYDGMMGVPISFLDKYCPDQFEILGITDRGNEFGIKTHEYTEEETPKANDLNRRGAIRVDGVLQSTYARILIRHKKGTTK